MDLLDKSIILELMSNSRVSCQELADRYGSTRGVVRKRIKRLENSGVIQKYSALYSPAMIDAEFVVGHVRISRQLGKEELVTELVEHQMIHTVIPVATGDIVFHAIVVGSDGLAELGSFLRKLDNVTEVELHLIQFDRGRKIELKNIHYNILSALFLNSRISVTEIARSINLSSRRVKRALDEIVDSDGISLAIARNPALGSGLSFYVKINWDERKIDARRLIEKIETRLPGETWESYISASEPIVFTRFFVEHIKNVEAISNLLSQFDEIISFETLIFYPARISSVLTRDRLGEDIAKAGFDVGQH